MARRRRAFTLLELLAAITLLVILGSMLFEIFGKASEVVRVSSARQEIFQYARAALEFLEREITGAFTGVDADVNSGNKGMRIYNGDSMGVPRRSDCQGIFFTTGIMARDTREKVNGVDNPLFGHDVNVARVAYYLYSGATEASSPDYGHLEKSALCRSEMYDLTIGTPEAGGPFVRNCLYFRIFLINQFAGGAEQFVSADWNSDETITVGGFARRRGLPKALFIMMRITDEFNAKQYRWDASKKKWFVPGPDPAKDYWGEEDPVVQSFSQGVYFGRRSD